ncbi:MAG: type II toxin-antitoxin system ParD family antitoxin [Rhodospirillaceae bacterium]|nr:type II toxin-antitoxin system ParD family antitoxin [Rhodospirillaceae bacterium]MDE0618275.1 type II toxin-antitoxin system ParD family antitoxin [Rhodospirillaceae bacterium]MYJ70198.1 type II toxin-antitoxin system ParD family antitoxin [Rhodospirillaceae bacterium]
MNVSLTATLEEFVRRKVASGLYNNASEVVREALRMLIERESGAMPDVRAGPLRETVLERLQAAESEVRQRGVASLALFGSAARGEAGPDSDIDILIDVAAGYPFSLVDLASLKNFLSDRLGHDVDIVTREGIAPTIGERVLRDAVQVF